MSYQVTKTYGHNLGLSCVFRQHRAQSHCRFLHGYALAVTLVFQSEGLNDNNWVIDFGSLKPVKQWLCDTFDHKLLVAEDDPALPLWLDLGMEKRGNKRQLADVVVIPSVGCEGFAKYIADNVLRILRENSDLLQGGLGHRCMLTSVEVREHGANSATYYPLELIAGA